MTKRCGSGQSQARTKAGNHRRHTHSNDESAVASVHKTQQGRMAIDNRTVWGPAAIWPALSGGLFAGDIPNSVHHSDALRVPHQQQSGILLGSNQPVTMAQDSRNRTCLHLTQHFNARARACILVCMHTPLITGQEATISAPSSM